MSFVFYDFNSYLSKKMTPVGAKLNLSEIKRKIRKKEKKQKKPKFTEKKENWKKGVSEKLNKLLGSFSKRICKKKDGSKFL